MKNWWRTSMSIAFATHSQKANNFFFSWSLAYSMCVCVPMLYAVLQRTRRVRMTIEKTVRLAALSINTESAWMGVLMRKS